ncbi:hypothetical protein [Lacinutrix salivirga]
MKRLLLFLVIAMQSCFCISQDLKPIVQLIKTEKYFCFDLNQSREIAVRLERAQFQDSIIRKLDFSIKLKDSLLVKKDSVLSRIKLQNTNLMMVSENGSEQILFLENQLKFKNKKLKQGRFHKILLGGGLLILSGILIAN